MERVPENDSENTTQWDAFEWAFKQAEHMSPTQHHVLLYLVGHAFYQEDNPESAEVGQVMRQASYVEEIMRGTGLKKDAIRKALTALQMAGYVQREVRKDPRIHGQQPHLIYVLWEADDLRQGLREGRLRLPAELLAVPTRPAPKNVETPVLSIVRGYDENAL